MASHFLQRTVQYVLLNAEELRIESIWELLRGAAAAAGPNSTLYGEIIEVINDMKDGAAKHTLTAYQTWIMISCLANRDLHQPGTNLVMINFMVNLKRLQALDYVLVPTQKEKEALLFQRENRFDWNMLAKSQAKSSKNDFLMENKSILTNKSRDNSILIFEINANGKCWSVDMQDSLNRVNT